VAKFIKSVSDEFGAITIDWVTLTVGILLLAITAVYELYKVV
jgi:hypothetical protein